MKRVPVRSSTIRTLGYSAARSVLEIEFTSGDIYRYRGVPAAEALALLKADSKGRRFNSKIRDRYPYTHI